MEGNGNKMQMALKEQIEAIKEERKKVEKILSKKKEYQKKHRI
ncbi:hypothetical protein AB3N02_22145 [Priestia aryabhattai]